MLAFFFMNITLAQEKSIYRQAYVDPFILNPAFTGSAQIPVARLAVEKRLVGFSNSPSTVLLTGNTRIGDYKFYTPGGLVNKGPLKVGNHTAFGGALFYDNNGPINSTGGMFSYAYHFSLTQGSALSMGLSAKLMNQSVNTSRFETVQPDDIYLLDDQYDALRLNFGIGFYFHTSRLFSGVSVMDLLPVESGTDTPVKKPGYHVLGGYRFNSVTPALDFEPSFLISKRAGENTDLNFYARVYYLNQHWAAVSYSTQGFIDIMLAVRLLNSLYLGYNYTYVTGKISSFSYGSHTISFGINLGLRESNS